MTFNIFSWRYTGKKRQRDHQRPHLCAMQETQVLSLGQEDSLEKEKARHSSILTSRSPSMEEPGRLQAMGSQIAGHD